MTTQTPSPSAYGGTPTPSDARVAKAVPVMGSVDEDGVYVPPSYAAGVGPGAAQAGTVGLPSRVASGSQADRDACFAAAGGAVDGDVWVNTDTNHLDYWSGGAWR